MNNFNNKVVVITGGATGIGFSFAKQFGNLGAKLVIASRRMEKVNHAVERLNAMGIIAKGISCDVSKYEAVEALADFAWKEFGHVDVIINNAGISQQPTPLIDMDIEDFTKVININIMGVVHGIKVFGKRFIEQGTPAAIYNVGSENGFFNGVPGASAYIATKHAVLAITDALREDTPDFIDVSLIVPGLVSSELADGFSAAMDTDKFTSIIMKQLMAGNFYCVSHAHNMEYINKRYHEIKEAYDTYAPRYENDNEFDVRALFQKLLS